MGKDSLKDLQKIVKRMKVTVKVSNSGLNYQIEGATTTSCESQSNVAESTENVMCCPNYGGYSMDEVMLGQYTVSSSSNFSSYVQAELICAKNNLVPCTYDDVEMIIDETKDKAATSSSILSYTPN